MAISETSRNEHARRVKACLDNIDEVITCCQEGEGTVVLRDLVVTILRTIRNDVNDIGGYVSNLPPNAHLQKLSTAWEVPVSELGEAIGVSQSSLELWLQAIDNQNFIDIIVNLLEYDTSHKDTEFPRILLESIRSGETMILGNASREGFVPKPLYP